MTADVVVLRDWSTNEVTRWTAWMDCEV